MKKHYSLEDDELILFIKDIKDKFKYKTEAAALRHIIQEYKKLQNEEELIISILKRYDEERNSFNERLRWAATTAEQNSILLLDAINTLMIKEKIEDCVPVDVWESPVISTSKEILKNKLAHFKQAKDYRNSKKGKRV